MKKSLYSSILALILMGASCGGEEQSSKSMEETSEPTEFESTEPAKSDAPESEATNTGSSSIRMISAGKVGSGGADESSSGSIDTTKQEVHDHSAPGQTNPDQKKANERFPEKK